MYNRKIFVEHNLQLTMVDAKVCNALSESFSSKWLWGAIPNYMNYLAKCLKQNVKRNVGNVARNFFSNPSGLLEET